MSVPRPRAGRALVIAAIVALVLSLSTCIAAGWLESYSEAHASEDGWMHQETSDPSEPPISYDVTVSSDTHTYAILAGLFSGVTALTAIVCGALARAVRERQQDA